MRFLIIFTESILFAHSLLKNKIVLNVLFLSAKIHKSVETKKETILKIVAREKKCCDRVKNTQRGIKK